MRSLSKINFITFAVFFILQLTACSTLPPLKKGSVSDEKYSAAIESIRKDIRSEMKKHHVVGLSIAVVDDQKIVWSEGFGYASKTQKVPATADTIYRIGSVSKLFTATAVMQLSDRGEIDIDKPLKAYLPEFNIKSRFTDTAPITVRSVLTHHAGLPRDYLKGWFTQTSTGAVQSWQNLAGDVGSEYVLFPPKFVYAYSNLGFSLLGRAVARVSGQDYDKFISSNIFTPLGMNHSSVMYKPEFKAYYSEGYFGKREVKNADIHMRDMSAGALLSSANDMAQFIKMVFADGASGQGAILKPGTLKEMLTPQNTSVKLDGKIHGGLAYGLSGIKELDYVFTATHGGYLPPFHSMVIMAPDQKLGVVVLVNTDGSNPNKLAVKMLSTMIEAKTGLKAPEKTKAVLKVVPLSKQEQGLYRAYFGAYNLLGEDGSLLEIEPSAKDLAVKVDGRRTIHLIPTGKNAFYFKVNLLSVFPVRLKNKNLNIDFIDDNTAVVRSLGVPYMIIERVAKAPLPETWKKRWANMG